ncbi:glycerol-3-phosphate dehydrogenase/oxidase [Raineyella sp. W15-4]|uniref:glycerol-3-phosphate dehydrogenase/oxidase n=1 Tax=Raineyella sp. W15-4 TaxID=3081651 RepID=UPI002953239E|nr:glycerol-3-phosphate dehydrogenase/oxidase [Raineyella sp. W15-4]WOQ18229.1 glycerol-3-phosphate dehydrogenase/oxidase [Raineyella sp. W15-4]
MASTRLTCESRQAALEAMADDEGLDVLVIGGGVTGAGIALDAATRDLRTGIVEARDWSQGTSSRSSKLVHGGLRYLYQLDFRLVAEALKERGLLLTTIAPHLVKAQPFLWPLRTPVIERAYSAIGVGLYDALAVIGAHGRTVPLQKHYSRKGAKQLFPGIREDALCGAIRFYDARVDDSRLVIDLVRTAAGHGALAASRTELTELVKDADGRVVGAVLTDLETGTTRTVKTRRIINATGVWTQQTQRLGGNGGLKVLASKGIHILVPRERIDATTGIFLRTEKSVLFIIPWQRYWVIGTTDTAWHEDLAHPVATSADIDYILEHANTVLADPLTRDDIIGTYAGLRPLLQPGTMDESQSTKISREHTVTQIAPGLVSIAGGKLTTYRVMAEDAVDFVLGKERATATPSRTTTTPLVGAEGLAGVEAQADRIAAERGWTADRLEHLLGRYGAELPTLLAMIDEDPALAEPLPEAEAYLAAEVAFAVTHEGALHLEDIVNHRVRLAMETPDRGISALPGIAAVAADRLGWDDATRGLEISSYERQARAELEAEHRATDADAVAARLEAEDLRPVRPLGA